jgi:hypothetical protein
VLPGGVYFIGGGTVLPGGAVFNGGPFTLLPLILLINGPLIIDDPEPINEEPLANDPSAEMIDEADVIDSEPHLELSPQ